MKGVGEEPNQTTARKPGPSEQWINKINHWVSSAFSFVGGVTSAQERCLTLNWYGLSISLAYPSEEEGGNLLVLMISTCCLGIWGRGEGVGTLWLKVRIFLLKLDVCRCSLYLVRGTPENQSQEPQLVAAVSRTGTFLIIVYTVCQSWVRNQNTMRLSAFH